MKARHYHSQKWKLYPQSVLNGVIGDYLENQKNALSLPMSFHVLNSLEPLIEENGKINSKMLSELGLKKRIGLYIHGAADNELCWYRCSHPESTNIAYDLNEAFDITPIFVRYNSGLSIKANSAKLAGIIDLFLNHIDETIELNIIAHSMGGLIFKRALSLAHLQEEKWLRNLNKIVYLGSPHHGAPLEDFGKFATGILDILPNVYTRLAAKIINLRSEGIKNLGSSIKEDRLHPIDELALQEYYIAATLFNNKENALSRYFGDIMVPIESAKNGLHDHEENVFIVTDTSHPKLPVSLKAYTIIENILKNNNE